jgi:predicted nucleic acid-binding protein
MNRMRIYIDTSVVGGCHDAEFERESRALLARAKAGKMVLLVSQTLIDELKLAPPSVQDELARLPERATERLAVTPEAVELQEKYLAAEVVSRNHSNDALHVAQATVARADLIVSWNFKHIVHFEKIRGFNAVNLTEGYLPIEIRSPLEVV